MNQIKLHNKIDALLLRNPDEVSQEEVSALVSANADAHHYFFTKADERWLSWLWNNGFLDVIKEKSEDPTRYGYRTPELNYLVKVVEKEPAKVVDIMLEVSISAGHFNPEVIDRFLWICSTLPSEQLARMVQKIREERWIPLMGPFNRWGFEYEKILKTLANAKDYDSILVLAEAILAVRTKEEIEKTTNRITTDNPFYFSDLSYTKVFEHLVNVDGKHKEDALAIAIHTLRNVVLTGESKRDGEVFEIEETFHLFDVDFFELQLGEKEHLSYRDDVRSLAAVVKTLTVSLIGEKCNDTENVQRLYRKHFAPLPDSRSLWRLRLFVLSLCPSVFKDELKQAFFRIFETDRYHEFISGTEYQKTLRTGFSVLSESDKREYVNKVLEYFSKRVQEDEDQKWHKVYGWRILSSICSQITGEENIKCEKVFERKCDPKYEPEPSIGRMYAGTVVPRVPPGTEDEWDKPVPDIVTVLKTKLTPKALSEMDSKKDFLRPINAEGVGERLRIEIKKRPIEYFQNAPLFFERDVLDQHYTYSFLRGIEETFRENKANFGGIKWDGLINLCVSIAQEGEKQPFESEVRERDTFDAWLSGWDGVHSAMVDVVEKLISEDSGKTAIDFLKYRDALFAIIRYLLAYPDPVPEDEKIESAGMKTKSPGSEEYLVSDPFTMAINTVRGRAFQVFVLFVYQDGKKFTKDESPKISSDVKKLYEAVLKNENTRALMFMFGHYLPSFYFRDKKWIQGLLLQIFPKEPEKKHLYTAAWEGYLSTNLYKKLFFDPDIQKLYKQDLALTEAEYPKQKHFKEPNEGIAIHLALAFIHFSEFGFGHNLFKEFWNTKNLKRHKEFISFIGRHSISREAAAEWIKYNKVDIEKLKKFWDWAIKYCNADELTEFGFWINVERGALDIKWLAQRVRKTLEKTKGYIEWEYGLMRSLAAFAKEAPEDTLAILRAHLLEEVAKHEPQRAWLHIDNEVLEAFKMLYENLQTKEGVRVLINDLLPYRNGLFWGLKSVLDESRLEKPKTK